MDTTNVIDEFIVFYQQIKESLQQDADGIYFYQHNNKRIYCDMKVIECKLAKNKYNCCMLGLWLKVNNRELPQSYLYSNLSKLTKLPFSLVHEVFFRYPLYTTQHFVLNLDVAIEKLTKYKLDMECN